MLNHKARVFVHCLLLGEPVRGFLHDLSKFSRVEWFGIGRNFYPSSESEKAENAALFAEAKERHRRLNEHELNHWYVDDGSALEIPAPVCREIVADWAAFSGWGWTAPEVRRLAFQSYDRWGKNYVMHPQTRGWFESYFSDLSTETSRG